MHVFELRAELAAFLFSFMEYYFLLKEPTVVILMRVFSIILSSGKKVSLSLHGE